MLTRHICQWIFNQQYELRELGVMNKNYLKILKTFTVIRDVINEII